MPALETLDPCFFMAFLSDLSVLSFCLHWFLTRYFGFDPHQLSLSACQATQKLRSELMALYEDALGQIRPEFRNMAVFTVSSLFWSKYIDTYTHTHTTFQSEHAQGTHWQLRGSKCGPECRQNCFKSAQCLTYVSEWSMCLDVPQCLDTSNLSRDETHKMEDS